MRNENRAKMREAGNLNTFRLFRAGGYKGCGLASGLVSAETVGRILIMNWLLFLCMQSSKV